MAQWTQGILVVMAMFFLGVADGRPKPCSLTVTPDDGYIRVLPGNDVSFVCSATCLGALSRDQLVWKDPRGKILPTVGGRRVHTVSYNRWMVSRLVVSSARPEDTGVYTCQVKHGDRLLQYPALLQVEDTRREDPGPRRGDIFIQPEPDLGPIRPVRSASRGHGNHRVTWPVKRDLIGGESAGLERAEVRGVGEEKFRGRRLLSYASASPSSSDSGFPPTTPKPSDQSDSDKSVVAGQETTEEMTVRPDPVQTSTVNEYDPTTGSLLAVSSPTPSTTTTTPRTTTTTTTSTSVSTTTTTKVTAGSGATRDDDDDDVADEGNSEKDMGADSSNTGSTKDTRVIGDSDFGRYGKLAFGLAMGLVVLLLYTLLLVIIVPRCRQRSKSHTLPAPSADVTATNGKGSDVIVMGERPQKPLAPMTSATGLNGEFITAVDLDNSGEGEGGKKEEGEEKDKEGDKEENKEAEKKEEEEKKEPDSFVSTFLIGRLSSSKPTDADTPTDASTAAGEDNVFTDAPPKAADDADQKQTTTGDNAAAGGSTLTPPAKAEESESKGDNPPTSGSGSDGALTSDVQQTVEPDGSGSNKPTDV